ncbi:MAG: S-layer homology domain-containing protein, partial [Firmicutes bacterium]|nr:S-layer homology domain-containing protein [Bacillota bacterium]
MKRRMLAVLLTLIMVIGMVPVTAFAAPAFNDIDGHWAEEAIDRWADYGIVAGMNGGFNPDGTMTRAQAAAVFANLFGLSKKADVSAFTDVEDAWYKDAIAMCVEAGIMSGVGGGKMDPHGTLTREQMFTMFANGLGIKPEAEAKKDFVDDHKTSSWAEGYINALVNRGFVSGMADNTLAPDKDINRASVMALLSASVTTYVTESGEVEAPADGDLIIVVADEVTITGEFSGTVLAVGGDTTIKVEDATADAEIVVASGSENVSVEGEFAGTVTVAAKETNVTVENAAKVEVATEGAKVEVTGTVKEVAVTEEAKETTVEVAKDAKVESVTTNASNTTVAGEGKVEKVEAAEGSTGTTVNTTGSVVENNSKEDVSVGTGKVETGEAGTSQGADKAPTEVVQPSTGGGSSSSSSTSKPSTPSTPSTPAESGQGGQGTTPEGPAESGQ